MTFSSDFIIVYIYSESEFHGMEPNLQNTRTLADDTLGGDRNWRKLSSVPGATIAIFADRCDRYMRSSMSGMSNIGDCCQR